MKIIITIFCLLILMFLASKLKINIEYLEKEEKSLKIHFKVNLNLYFLGIIKIFGISFKENGIYFLNLKIPYRNIKIRAKKIEEIAISKMIKSFKLKLEYFNLDLNIGTESVMFTALIVPIISTILSLFYAKNQKKIKKYYYKINPIYNSNTINFKISAKISFNIFNLIKTLIWVNKNTKTQKQYKIHITNIPSKFTLFCIKKYI